jgi:hypothetical protein
MVPQTGLGASVLLGVAFAVALAMASGCKRGSAPEERVGPPSVACALAGLDRGAVRMVLETDEGAVHCTIDANRAPRAAVEGERQPAGREEFRQIWFGLMMMSPY